MMWLWFLLGALAVLTGVVLLRGCLFRAPKATPVAPVYAAVDGDAAARALSALVQCKTVSHADASQDDVSEFERLIALLPTLFPRVHAACAFETIGDRGILYRWKGERPENPLVLTAHYDVVPADAELWDGDPFSGEIFDGIIHGRGTLDTKCTLSAVLSAAETLLAQDFHPARDIYFCFAGNEEVMGDGAAAIVETLEKRGITPLCVVDEGGAIVEKVFPGVTKPCALIGVGEKGSVNYGLGVRAKGGHSSAPLPNSPVDILAEACLSVKKRPFPFRVTPPAALLIDGLARHSSFAYRVVFANLWLFAPVLNLLCLKSGGELNALFRTTTAFTVFKAGDAANVLPPAADMVINVRVLPGETIEGTLDVLRQKVNDPRVEVRLLRGQGPSASSGIDGAGYAALCAAIGEVYPDVLISPYLMIAGSDARHYERICPHVYRFSGMPLTVAERRMIHGANEQIPVAKQADTVRFFMRLMENAAR